MVYVFTLVVKVEHGFILYFGRKYMNFHSRQCEWSEICNSLRLALISAIDCFGIPVLPAQCVQMSGNYVKTADEISFSRITQKSCDLSPQ